MGGEFASITEALPRCGRPFRQFLSHDAIAPIGGGRVSASMSLFSEPSGLTMTKSAKPSLRSEYILNHAYWPNNAMRLAKMTDFCEPGLPALDKDPNSFARRLNMLSVSRKPVPAKCPQTLVDAITSEGSLKRNAAIYHLAIWLLKPGQLERIYPRGQRPDAETVLKTSVAIVEAVRVSKIREHHNLPHPGRNSRKKHITKHDISRAWDKLFDDVSTASQFDARIRSVTKILHDYRCQLKAGAVCERGKAILRSSLIEDVLFALRSDTRTNQRGRSTQCSVPVLRSPRAFPVPLAYSSPQTERQYRATFKETPATCLTYDWTFRDSGNLVPVPRLAVKDDYRTRALIDRIVLLVAVPLDLDHLRLHQHLLAETSLSLYVKEVDQVGKADHLGLTVEYIAKPIYRKHRVLMVLVQDVSPQRLALVEAALRRYSARGFEIQVHLIEVSVDFCPCSAKGGRQGLLRREQMVGLLQRHHWTPPERFQDLNPKIPAYTDARHFADRGRKPQFLFARVTGSRFESDISVRNPHVLDRILTSKTPEGPFLDSTVWKGERDSQAMVSIQHKVADRRNSSSMQALELPETDRRARIEVTLSGSILIDRGLDTIQDLSAISFRKLTSGFLQFRLPCVSPKQELVEDAEAQLRNRGVYGWALREKAREQQRREDKRRAGERLPRASEGYGGTLVAWSELNAVTGAALDGLTRGWSRYRSS